MSTPLTTSKHISPRKRPLDQRFGSNKYAAVAMESLRNLSPCHDSRLHNPKQETLQIMAMKQHVYRSPKKLAPDVKPTRLNVGKVLIQVADTIKTEKVKLSKCASFLYRASLKSITLSTIALVSVWPPLRKNSYPLSLRK